LSSASGAGSRIRGFGYPRISSGGQSALRSLTGFGVHATQGNVTIKGPCGPLRASAKDATG